jgi:hypothetical protein
MVVVHNAHATVERRRILTAFRSAGALSPERAKPLQALGLEDSRYVRNFRSNQIIREVKAGDFYLDEDAYREYMSAIRRWLLVLAALLLAFATVMIILTQH